MNYDDYGSPERQSGAGRSQRPQAYHPKNVYPTGQDSAQRYDPRTAAWDAAPANETRSTDRDAAPRYEGRSAQGDYRPRQTATAPRQSASQPGRDRSSSARQGTSYQHNYRSGGSSGRTSGGSSGRRPPSRRSRVKASPLFSMLFFPCALLYHEILLRAYDPFSDFVAMGLMRILFFSLAIGFLVFVILDLIPQKKAARWIGGIIIFAFIVILCVQRGMQLVFQMYYGIFAAAETAGDAMTNFKDTLISAIISLLPFIFLSLIPFVIYCFMSRVIIYERGQQWIVRVLIVAVVIVAHLFGWLLCSGDAKEVYTYNFSTNLAIPEFGLATSIRLEFQYKLFGMPEEDLSGYLPSGGDEDGPDGSDPDANDPNTPDNPDDPNNPDVSDPNNPDGQDPNGQDPNGQTPVTPPREFGPNVIDTIDFNALASGSSGKIQQLHEYFGSLTPSMENEYTGMFKDKNLILLTAEAFCPYAIDQELTPTLYRLTHEAFVFNNFYQPDWALSTVGGEFSVTTGVIPNWVDGSTNSARKSIGNSMPTTLGNMFKAIGYTTPAWHNGDYTYYKRDQYLKTYGYDYHGEGGGGLDLPTDNWPRSDKEMIEATADSYINAYVQTGQKFHAYYMTISGHGNYSFSYNHRSAQYKDLVQAKYPNLSEPCQAYIACNIDLDRALEILVQKLEAAGIADDTLIVMCADHYPYMLAYGNSNDAKTGDGNDYYNELTQALIGKTDTQAVTGRYRNTLLMWSAAITEPIVVDTPCYSCDIVPTVANLFGLDYDSRLYSGRDIFATNYEADKFSTCMPLVVFANTTPMKGNSWITAAGTYESSTKTFTPNPGITVSESYVSQVNELVRSKISFSKQIVTQDYYAKVFG